MNVAWIKGTLTEDEMEDEHPLELEALRAKEHEKERSEHGEARVTEPPQAGPTISGGNP